MTRGAPIEDENDQHLEVHHQKEYAAGVPAVLWTMRITDEQMGVRRTVKTMLRINQPDGFDCPGCAWPDDTGKRLDFCENGAKAVAEEATLRRVGPDFFAEHPLGVLDDKSEYWLGQQGRITNPMYRAAGDDTYRPIAWDDAYGLIADAIAEAGDPNRVALYTSGRTSNEAAYLWQLFARQLGTNNLPDCSNMCHESTSVALAETVGVGKGTVTLDDVHNAELILIVGQNPGTNHPRMLSALEVQKDNGGKIVAINPLAEAGLIRFKDPQKVGGVLGRGVKIADHHLAVRLGADLPLFQWLNRRLLELDAERGGGVVDRDFVDGSCVGFDDLAAHLLALDPDELAAAAGVPADELEPIAQLLADHKRIVICWAMGVTQHHQGVATIKEMTNTILLRGAIGLPGAGLCPVRGHSNVQGDRTMGIWEKPPEALLDALAAEFDFEPPRAWGLDAVETIEAMGRGDIDVFLAMGGNFVHAAPDTDVTVAALARTKLSVHVSTKLNRSHVHGGQASLILPCLGRTEVDMTGGRPQRVTVEDSMSMVHASVGRLEPASPALRSEPAIVCGMAERVLGDRTTVDWSELAADYDRIRDHIEATIPGFDDFNTRIDQPGGFQLPSRPRDERSFDLPDGKAVLSTSTYEPLPVPEGYLVMQTFRSHDQYNTTIYGLNDRYRGIEDGRRVVFISREDLARLGRTNGEIVDIVSIWRDDPERRAPRFRLVEYDIAPGTCAAYYPETNVLVPLSSVAAQSNTPTSKAIIVRFESPQA